MFDRVLNTPLKATFKIPAVQAIIDCENIEGNYP